MLALASGAGWGDDAFGTWRMNPRRSTFGADPALTLRIERHVKGEVLTLDRTDSTILYLDGKPTNYRDLDFKGTQTSQRVDNRTVEIQRACDPGGWIRVIRRVTTDTELVLQVSRRRSYGREVEMRWCLRNSKAGIRQ